MKTKDQDSKIMDILKVNEISRIICDTNMGTLKLRIRKGETAYKFILDAVELPKDLNNELMEAIYPPQTILQELKETKIPTLQIDPRLNISSVFTAKQKGRPKGSKNKVK